MYRVFSISRVGLHLAIVIALEELVENRHAWASSGNIYVWVVTKHPGPLPFPVNCKGQLDALLLALWLFLPDVHVSGPMCCGGVCLVTVNQDHVGLSRGFRTCSLPSFSPSYGLVLQLSEQYVACQIFHWEMQDLRLLSCTLVPLHLPHSYTQTTFST